MLAGVFPSISLASFPTAIIFLVFLSLATTDGSFNTIFFLCLSYINIFAVPRSIDILLLTLKTFKKSNTPIFPPIFYISLLFDCIV